MRQRGYVIAFVVLLLLAAVGGFVGGRLLLERLQGDFTPRAGWTPQVAGPTAAGDAPLSPTGTPAVAATQPPRPTATMLIVPTPAGVPAVPVESPAPTPPAADEVVTPTPDATETASPTPSPQTAFPYVLARPVRHSAGDCPGVYVLGQVTDRAGNLLPNVRLKLTDEYGTPPAFTASKAGQADLGRYDFPLFGPPRRFYLKVVDEADRPLSAEVEIPHGLPPNAEATCHWVDWRRQ